jgi:hypothetical protein
MRLRIRLAPALVFFLYVLAIWLAAMWIRTRSAVQGSSPAFDGGVIRNEIVTAKAFTYRAPEQQPVIIYTTNSIAPAMRALIDKDAGTFVVWGRCETFDGGVRCRP